MSNNTTNYTVEYTPAQNYNKSIEGAIRVERPEIKGYALRAFGDNPLDLNHNYPMHFDDIIVENGVMGSTMKNKGFWFELPGSINGNNGYYQVGMGQDGIIYHRGFIDNRRYLKK